MFSGLLQLLPRFLRLFLRVLAASRCRGRRDVVSHASVVGLVGLRRVLRVRTAAGLDAGTSGSTTAAIGGSTRASAGDLCVSDSTDEDYRKHHVDAKTDKIEKVHRFYSTLNYKESTLVF